jgi:hypothetical protein
MPPECAPPTRSTRLRTRVASWTPTVAARGQPYVGRHRAAYLAGSAPADSRRAAAPLRRSHHRPAVAVRRTSKSAGRRPWSDVIGRSALYTQDSPNSWSLLPLSIFTFLIFIVRSVILEPRSVSFHTQAPSDDHGQRDLKGGGAGRPPSSAEHGLLRAAVWLQSRRLPHERNLPQLNQPPSEATAISAMASCHGKSETLSPPVPGGWGSNSPGPSRTRMPSLRSAFTLSLNGARPARAELTKGRTTTGMPRPLCE